MGVPDAWLPWLAVAGIGVLHGLNPANGWLFAAGRAVQRTDGTEIRRSLLPLAAGHAVSLLLVVVVAMQGVAFDGARLHDAAGAALLAVAFWQLVRRRGRQPRPASTPARLPVAGLALWSCLMGSAHGSGLMLLPALVPLCVSTGPARAIGASGSLVPMLAAVVLHLLAMLLTTHAIASGVFRGLPSACGTRHARHLASLWALALAVTGIALIARD